MKTLTPEEQQYLYREIMFRKRQEDSRKPRRRWSEIAETVQYPMPGEDAQEWVTRERQAWSERESKLRGE